jgi:hypothetical protein
MRSASVALLLLACAAVDSHAAGPAHALRTAKRWIKYQLGPDWKLVQSTKAPQAGDHWSKRNPVSQSSDFDAGLAIETFQTEWPEVSARYLQLVNTIGGAKSNLGQWTLRQAGLRFGQKTYTYLVAYRDIADVHMYVSLKWFRLPQNDAQYDAQMASDFRSLLQSISAEPAGSR